MNLDIRVEDNKCCKGHVTVRYYNTRPNAPAYIGGLYVLPSYRKQGIATHLMKQACQTARAWGAKDVELFVGPYGDIGMTKTQLFYWYAKLGFGFDRKEGDTIYMKKSLQVPEIIGNLTHCVISHNKLMEKEYEAVA